MSALTEAAGYPVHAVAEFARWTNQYQVPFTTWRAHCGTEGTVSGHGPFNLAGQARRLELCETCFPGRQHNAAPAGGPAEVPRWGW